MKKQAGKKHTIYDIAEMAGVSTATVSRVINNSPKVDFETRKKILDIFDQLRYRPKIIRNRITNIGVLIEMQHYAGSCFSDYITGILEGVTEYVYKNNLGMQMTPFERSSIHYAEDIATYLMEKDISGAVFINPPEDADYIYALDSINFPYMVIGSDFSSKEINSIDIDNTTGVKSAVEYLVDSGHRKIGFVSISEKLYAHRKRFSAFRETLGEHDIPVKEEFVLYGDKGVNGEEIGYNIILKFREHTARFPTAFFCLNDEIAFGVIRSLFDSGMRVPDDVSVIGFDDYRGSMYSVPKLTSVKSPLHMMGYTACERVERWVKGRKERERVLYPSELVIRESCRNLVK